MNNWKKIVLITIGALAALILFSWAVLPVLIKNKAVDLLKEATGRNAAIEKISLNPLTLTAQVKNLSLEESGGGGFFSVGNIRVSVSPSSIYRRALVLSEVSIASPSLRIVRDQPDHFNFSDILERRKKEEKPKNAGIFPLVVHNFHLDDGACDLEDRVIAGGRDHSIKKLAISLPWLSTLPKDADREATPHISAIVNGAPLTLDGKTKPFSADMASALHITLQEFNLPELAAYIPQAPPVDMTSGRLTIDAEFLYRQTSDGKPVLSLKGLTRLDDLNINLLKGRPLLKLPSVEIAASRIEPMAGVFAVDRVTLAGLELFVSRDKTGKWMAANLLKQGNEKTEKKGSQPAPSFSLSSLALQNGRIHFRDDLPPKGFNAVIENIRLDIKNAANIPGQTGHYNLAFRIDSDADFSSSGSFTLPEPAANVSLKLAGLPLQKGWPYLSDYLTAPFQGIIDLSGEAAYSKKEGLTAQKGRLTVTDFSARYGNKEGVDLKLLAITGAAFNQKSSRLDIDQIRLSGGNVSLSLHADGKLSAQSLIKSKQYKTTEKPTKDNAVQEKSSTGKKAASKPLAYHLKRLELDNTEAAFTDLSHPLKPRFTLRKTSLSLSDIKGPASHPAKLRFSAIFGTNSAIKASGSVTPSPFFYRGNLQIGQLPIRAFEAYYPANFNFQILGGLVDTDMALDIAIEDKTPAVTFKGNAGISSFHIVDAVEQEDLLKWKRLQVEGMNGNTQPFRLAIGKVSLNEPYARIIIREDGTLNLQELMRKETDKSQTPAEAEASEKKTPNPVETDGLQKKPPEVRVENVTILDGTVSFTDKYLPNDFDTSFYNLGGRISGLTSEASLMADVDLRGNLENQSPLLIKGKINPLREDLYVDLKFSFSDIDLSPMSSYSETYLGYILKQGKLNLDLTYHIEDKKLVSENRIMVDQFAFGDKVESDKATSLPVKLGIALLRDNKGEIHLDVPVTGRLDDPQFNIWRIVFQVVKNLLVKAVTAPFSLLSSLFGGGNDLSVISFSAGSSLIEPAEEKKLAALAKGLSQRPSLKIALSAYVDAEKDAEGYQNELFKRKLQREKMLAATRKETPSNGKPESSSDLSPEERSLLLKSLYAREKFPKPRDASGKEVVLPEEEMVKLMLANIKVEKDALEDLAEERAAAAMQFLIQHENIPAERIFRQKEDIFKMPAQKETPPSRVEMNAIAN